MSGHESSCVLSVLRHRRSHQKCFKKNPYISSFVFKIITVIHVGHETIGFDVSVMHTFSFFLPTKKGGKFLFRIFGIPLSSRTVRTLSQARVGGFSQAPLPLIPFPKPPRMWERSAASGDAVGRVLLAVDNSAYRGHEPVQAYSLDSLL